MLENCVFFVFWYVLNVWSFYFLELENLEEDDEVDSCMLSLIEGYLELIVFSLV